MSRTVFDLEGKVGLEDKNFIARAKRVKQALTDMQHRFKSVSSTSAGLRRPTKEYRELERQVRQAEKAVTDLKRAQDRQTAQHKKSETYKSLQKDIQATEAELDGLIEKQIEWAEIGVVPGNRSFQELDAQIERTSSKLEEMRAALKAIEETGATDEEAQDWFKTADAIDKAEDELRRYKAQRASLRDSGKAFQQTAAPATGGLKRFGANFSKGLSKGLLGLIRPQKRVADGFKNISKQAQKMKKGLFMGAGIKGLARVGIAGAAVLYTIRMLRQGLENLRGADARTNASLNQMSASLTTLKNALATAFAPILNVIVPILSKFIDWLVAGITAVAHFMAALTGQSQVTVARKAISGVSGAASDAAGATNDANEAAQEYQRTLAGFDQINKLDAPTSSSGSGGSGGGGSGGGGSGSGSMFETVPVSSVMADWADRIKEAWENADFYDIGRAVGEKLRDSLQQIPWDDIQAVGAKIGKSVATGLNGFFETPDLGRTIGATIAEALNTIVITVDSFAINFHWDSLGKFVGEGINGFFETFDWKLTGQTMSNLATGILDATIEAVRTVDWRLVGSSIMDMITSIDYIGIATRLITLLSEAISGAGDLLSGAIDTLKEKLVSWIESGDIWKDIGSLGSAVIDLSVNILGAAWDVLTSLIDLGASVAIALIKSGWSKISEFIGEKASVLLSLAKDGWTSLKEFVGEKVSAGLSLVQDGWDTLKDWVTTYTGGAVNKAVGLVASFGKKARSTIAGWLGDRMGGAVNKAVGLVASFGKKARSTIAGWLGDRMGGAVNKAVGLAKNFGKGVATVAGWLSKRMGGAVTKAIGLAKDGWSTVKNWIAMGGAVSKGIGLAKDGWDTVSKWVKESIGKTVKIGVSLMKSGWSKLKDWLFGASGGYITSHGIKFFAGGGIGKNGKWQPIAQYANGGGAPGGQVFVAREAGPELVGTIGTRSAIMNNDQIVASVAAGVAQAVAQVIKNVDFGGNSTTVVLEGEAGALFRVVQQMATDYTRTTGQPAFPV